MKNVLILAYDFPPFVSVGGQRPYNWFKHFSEFGIYPIVVTRQWENKHKNYLDYIEASSSDKTIVDKTEFGTVLRTPYAPNIGNKLLLRFGTKKFTVIRKIISYFFEIFQFISIVGPKKNLFIEADNYMREYKVDCIIATGEPFVLFHYAHMLSKKYNVPWTADYRDPWALCTFNFVSPLLKTWFVLQEKRLLKSVNMIVTVSDFLARNLNNYNANKVPIEVIPNGYDSDLTESIEMIPQDSTELTFAYAGMIYPYHPCLVFFKVLEDILRESDSVRFKLNFYGINIEREVKENIDKNFPSLKRVVNFFPRIPNKELLEELSKSNALILFNEYSFMGTKIYDYIGVNRYILHLFTNEENANRLKEDFFPMKDLKGIDNNLQEKLIKYTNTGTSIEDALKLKEEILRLFEQHKKEGSIKLHSQNREDFSRKHQTEKFAKILLKGMLNE